MKMVVIAGIIAVIIFGIGIFLISDIPEVISADSKVEGNLADNSPEGVKIELSESVSMGNP